MGMSGMARKALDAVQQFGGETSSHAVSRRLGAEPSYGRLLCLNLAREDYLDLKPSGLFKITRKGQQALDGGAVTPSRPGRAGPGKEPTRQALGWHVASRGPRGWAQRPSFPKPGQEPIRWHAVKVDSAGGLRATTRAGQAARVLHEGTWPCGFCRGKGQRPPGANCPVCRGTGTVSLSPPVARCAFCKGRGDEKARSNLTCTVCRGKGYVQVGDPATVCARCNGTGKERNNKLPCLACKGKGLVGERRPSRPLPKGNPEDHLGFWQREELRQKVRQAGGARTRAAPVSGTEMEVLKAYCEAEEAGEAPDVPRRTTLSDGYVSLLRQSLLGKGLLVRAGPCRHRVSDAGRAAAPSRGAQAQAGGN